MWKPPGVEDRELRIYTLQRSNTFWARGFPRRSCSNEGQDNPLNLQVVSTDFWYAQGIFLIDILENWETVTWLQFNEILYRFNKTFKQTRLHLGKKKALFHHDKTSAYSSRIDDAKLYDLRYGLMSHRAYSADLVSSIFLFRNIKIWLGGNDSIRKKT